MPSQMLAQVSILRGNNKPEDAVTNTFHFLGKGVGNTVLPAEGLAVANKINAFYKTPPAGQSSTVMSIMSALMSPNGAQIKIYDLALPKPRPPFVVYPLTGLNFGTSVFPAEVALTLSFRAALEAGSPPARRRGRIYIGPLGSGSTAGASNGDVRPSDNALNILASAAADLMLDAVGGEVTWAQRSIRDNVLRPIVHAWVDDAFDTQRRRGSAATKRVTKGA